jgi:DNA repair protein RadC
MRRRPNDTIRAWPSVEQPRERLLRLGATALSDAEVLAILLRVGHASTGETALDQARALLQRFGSLHGLDGAPMCRLCRVAGIGPAKAAGIKAALEMGKRLATRPLERGAVLRSSRDVYRHYRARLSGVPRETFWVVLLDTKNRILTDAKISEGSLSAAVVHPREVFRPAVEESAAAVILVHNHPSGDPTPSAEDVAITRRLREAGDVVGVKVLDHVVIGTTSYASFVERGLIP